MARQASRLDSLDAVTLSTGTGCVCVMFQAGQQLGMVRGQVLAGDGRLVSRWGRCGAAVWRGHGSISRRAAVEFGDKVFKGGFTVSHAQFNGIRTNPHVALAEVGQHGFNTEAAIVGYVLDKDVGQSIDMGLGLRTA
ncbi:hypothetical protein D3C76_1167980 [compost metagenome]